MHGPNRASPGGGGAAGNSRAIHFFDAIYCVHLDSRKDRWESVTKHFDELGIAHRVQRFPAIETPLNRHIGRALSHRAVIAEAKKYGFRNLLVFEDDVVFAPGALETLGRSIRELKRFPWNLFYLGGHAWGQSFEKADGCSYLEIPRNLTCTHAIAYHESVYGRILAEVPATATGVALWLRKEHGIGQYFSKNLHCMRFLTSPVVAAQPHIMPAAPRSFGAEA